ncbi:MarR family transcriptional regulator [Streptomyces sulfonofaciens]|uniref:MarR family transcriptional regulator n=1 Tax=Streptomyces sulfonofaciens TaxID=68272 RepID=A0A919GH46_9ACTN|nr:MarR family transcriptional regulator [Streptomyces sulfonofaciens]GHH83865.1 MarR family transcriptional regulator [Streptomyces sulfonofaciens]
MCEPHWLDERESKAWTDFLTAFSVLSRRIEQSLKGNSGLTAQQYDVLVNLGNAPGRELRMTELAEAVLLAKSSVTYQVGQLEKAGLVRRTSCEGDDRGVRASLTGAGWRKLSEAAPAHVASVRRHFIDAMSASDFEALARGLGALADSLRTLQDAEGAGNRAGREADTGDMGQGA